MPFTVPLISVIIPCYNAEAQINRCLDSVLAQSFKDFELIIIDDGSIDKSAEVLLKYSASDSRIKVFTQTNQGPSAARNLGIKKSAGAYILFIDIDDYIGCSYIEDFVINGIEKDCLYVQGHTVVYQNGETKVFDVPSEGGVHIFYESLSKGKLLHHGFPWGKLFNSDIIKNNNINFIESITYKEDLVFLLEYMKHCKHIKFIPKSSYHYTVNEGSLSHRKQAISSLIATYITIKELLPPPNAYIVGFMHFSTNEIFQHLYTSGLNKRRRLIYVCQLRQIVPQIFMPRLFKSDNLLNILFRLKLFRLYDFLQLQLHRKRFPNSSID